MATILENYQTTLQLYSNELAAGNIKPNYSIEGQSVDWIAYNKFLIEQIKELTLLIAGASPFEICVRTD